MPLNRPFPDTTQFPNSFPPPVNRETLGMESVIQEDSYDNTTTNSVQLETAVEPPMAPDVENPVGKESTTAGVDSIVQRWKREDLIEKSTLVLRSVGCFFSLLSLIIMASNKHGDWREFENYEEFRYVVGITVLGFLYSMFQIVLQGLRITGHVKELCSRRNSAIFDFAGDQVISYLLISAMSSAIPMTNRMREGSDNIFTDSLAASICMAFFAFLALGFSSIISGYKLSTQTDI